MKKLFIVFISCFLLSSCGSTDEKIEKKLVKEGYECLQVFNSYECKLDVDESTYKFNHVNTYYIGSNVFKDTYNQTSVYPTYDVSVTITFDLSSGMGRYRRTQQSDSDNDHYSELYFEYNRETDHQLCEYKLHSEISTCEENSYYVDLYNPIYYITSVENHITLLLGKDLLSSI